MTAFADNKN